MLSKSLDRSVSERLRQERTEGLPVSISFEECSTWADDFRGAVLRHYTGSKGNERLRAQEPKYLDSEGVGKFLGISETLARKLMKAGKLPVVVIPSTSNAEERELRRCLNTELVEFLRKRSAP